MRAHVLLVLLKCYVPGAMWKVMVLLLMTLFPVSIPHHKLLPSRVSSAEVISTVCTVALVSLATVCALGSPDASMYVGVLTGL